MYFSFKKLFLKESSLQEIAWQYAALIKLPVTKTSMRSRIKEHPDYPSLLALNDTFSSYGATTLSVRITPEQLQNVEIPFVIQTLETEERESGFRLALPPSNGQFTYLDTDTDQWKTTTLDQFSSLFTGFSFFAETQEFSGEKNYEKNKLVEKRNSLLRNLTSLLFISLIGVLIVGNLWFSKLESVAAILYFLLSLLGLGATSLLLWHEVDQYNPIIRQFCSGGKSKVNCNAVLESKGSKFFGISWSVFGFAYFASAFFSLLLSGIDNLALFSLLSLMSIFAIPYVFFSIYYQWRVVKQWCMLCLIVQGVIIIQAAVILMWKGSSQFLGNQSFTLMEAISLLLIFCIFVWLTQKGIVFSNAFKVETQYRMDLNRIKFNSNLFQTFLELDKNPIPSPEGLGIILGNPEGKTQLIKVCNPYCGPCANAQQPVEEILQQNPDVQLRIIFTARNQTTDRGAEVVKHLMGLTENRDNAFKEKILSEWYGNPKKNYKEFATKYPLDTNYLDFQSIKLDHMAAWCEKAEIKRTPTFFINGKELPGIYTVKDLNYLLKT